ncbi:MAG: aldehyde dehydrogenase family protein [Gammaproteobacteria bacterium]|nr:MAG: aldehyde dehydrogenase family protein [Gammaproteobacteria bacterium]
MVYEVTGHWVAGEWILSGESPVRLPSPIDGSVLTEVRFANAALAERAVAAAYEARDAMEALSPDQRGDLLRALATRLREDEAALCERLVQETGCPVRQAPGLQIQSAASLLEALAQLAETYPFEVWRPALRGGRVLLQKHPVGVCAGIVPWNVPLFLAAVKLGSAIASGCPIVLKPSPENAASMALVSKHLSALELPVGGVSVLTAGRELGRRLVADPRVAKVSFTGSTAAGREVAVECSRRLARFTLELGGKSAGIVLEDADPERIQEQLLLATLQNNGQVCGAQTRLLFPAHRFRAWTTWLAEVFDGLVVADPRLSETDIGPLVSATQRERVIGAVTAAQASGVRRATARSPVVEGPGAYVAPVLLTATDQTPAIVQEEIFGPVIVALPYRNEDEAIDMANDSRYGLAGSVWSASPERAIAVARRLRTGSVGINTKRMLDFGSPFGGMRESGIGRELGPEGLDGYLETKAVLVAEVG